MSTMDIAGLPVPSGIVVNTEDNRSYKEWGEEHKQGQDVHTAEFYKFFIAWGKQGGGRVVNNDTLFWTFYIDFGDAVQILLNLHLLGYLKPLRVRNGEMEFVFLCQEKELEGALEFASDEEMFGLIVRMQASEEKSDEIELIYATGWAMK